MRKTLTPQSSLDQLKQDAKRWLAALKSGDPTARATFSAHHPNPPATPVLRDVQLALARVYGFPGWIQLREALATRTAATDDPRQAALQALGVAANTGHLAGVEAILDTLPELINEYLVLPGHTGRRTALHFAMNSMREPIVAALLAAGADPNIRDQGDNAMPLHFAAEKGNLAVVRLLVEHGADPIGTGDMHQLDVIGWAAVFGKTPHLPVIEYLLAHGARHNIASAVAVGDTAAIRAIAATSRADLDRPMDETNHRRHPLHLSILKQQPASLATLLELGADTAARDAAGLTPLDQAALSGELGMVDVLLAHGATVDLPAAVALGRTADVERLLRKEPDALRRGGRWQRLLIRAAERGSGELIRLLVRSGASVHTRDDSRTAVDGTHGYTALHAAAFHGNMDAVRTLLSLGADPAAREDKYWGTPAGWADHAGHSAVREVILEAPIDLFEVIATDRVARIGETLERDPAALERPFGQLVTGDRKSEWLDRAWTPLHFAVAQDKPDAVAALLARGADRSVKDSDGRTALELAVAKGFVRSMELLRAAAPPVRSQESFDRLVARSLSLACLDWRVGGSAWPRAKADAGRLFVRRPEIARANLLTAIVTGDVAEVRRRLEAQPESALLPGGPRRWAPILYLCSARLPQPESGANAAEILRLLLDAGADPGSFYLGGNADIHYTALTCVLGRGEEQAETHPAARELTELLLERGADPCDSQVVYNVFGDHASRHYLDDDIVWLLELMHRYSVRRGRGPEWQNPGWPQFDLRGAPSLGDGAIGHYGAHFMLKSALDRNRLRLAEWMLQHGAGPDTPPGPHRNASTFTLWRRRSGAASRRCASCWNATARLRCRWRSPGTTPFSAPCWRERKPASGNCWGGIRSISGIIGRSSRRWNGTTWRRLSCCWSWVYRPMCPIPATRAAERCMSPPTRGRRRAPGASYWPVPPWTLASHTTTRFRWGLRPGGSSRG
ncbi:MAG: ankyrin repeat domain-containing protein [Gemmatimonadota bacterium]